MSDPHRILVIDDNPEIHADFRKVLMARVSGSEALAEAESLLFGDRPTAARPVAFTVDVASQGEDGLALVQRAIAEGRPYAAAFVDMRMPPGWDGLETIERLMPADPQLQLVICTAYSDYSWQQLAQQLGSPDRLLILKKPFDPIEILQLAHALGAKWTLARQADGERGRLERAVAERTSELALANTVLNRSVLELRTTVAQLGRSEARFRGVVESAAAAIVIIDERGSIWLWNPGAERVFGWSAADVVGRNIGDMVPALAALPADTAGHPLELPGRSRDGGSIELEISLSRWQTDDGIFACCIMHDIGPRKQAQAAILQARDAAEQAAAARSDFLAVVSHELRTPMNGIIGMSDLLLETGLDAEQREFAGTVRNCAATLLGQINEILDFSRIEAGRMEVQQIDFDPRSAGADVLELLIPQARAKGLELLLKVDAVVPGQVAGDPTRFKQILTNLIGNAVKFTTRGRITVSLRRHCDVDDVLVIEVEDTGIGISSEVQEVLFEPFVQIESAITRRHGGTGLGLAICRRLTSLMGGRIGYDSEPGRGSRFWCELPMPARPDPVDEHGGGLDGLRVLCVDPNPSGREATAGLLAGTGVAMTHAADADDGLAILGAAQDAVDVVLIECRSGDDDGLAVAARFQDADAPPILLLVRNAKPGLGGEARDLGVAGLLTHPLIPGQLREALCMIRTGGRIGTGMLTRHSLNERRRRRRPWVLLAVTDAAYQHHALIRLQELRCRIDVCAPGELAAACSRRRYHLALADFAATDAPDPDIVRSGVLPGGRTVLLSYGHGEGRSMPGVDGVVPGPPAVAGFEAEIRRHLPDRRDSDVGIDPVITAIDAGRLGTRERIETFALTLPASASAVMLAVARNDLDAVRLAAEALHGLCQEAGAMPLAALAEEFIRLAVVRDLPACARAAGELHELLRHALAALERMRRP